MQETPVGSVFVGLVLGVCMILYFALRKKSADPPSPLSILEPMTQVLFAWAYMSLQHVSKSACNGRSGSYTSTGVFIAITPSRLMISGEFETC